MFAAVVVAVCGFVALYVYALRYIFQFSIQHGEIVIKLFGAVPIRHVRISDIEKAEVITWKNLLPGQESFQMGYLFAERWPGYLSLRGLGIKKHHGLSRWLVISPENPEGMLELIEKERLEDRGQ